jgi:hypothetical protein
VLICCIRLTAMEGVPGSNEDEEEDRSYAVGVVEVGELEVVLDPKTGSICGGDDDDGGDMKVKE